MLTKAAKNELVEKYSVVFKANPSVMVVEYKGLTVKELEGLRKSLQQAGTDLKVVKNTLLRIAAKDTEIERIEELFEGPTAVAICESDASAAAKVFVDSAKKLPNLKLKGGIVEGTVVGESGITDISRLPSRQELIAQFIGLLAAPMSNLLGTLNQMQSKVLYALDAVKEKKEKEGN
jgi:large subunit ribosomal protein L10